MAPLANRGAGLAARFEDDERLLVGVKMGGGGKADRPRADDRNNL